MTDRLTAVVGRRYRIDDYYEVGREKIREFARAVRADHPVHWDESVAAEYGYPGLPAPPTFGCLLSDTVQQALTHILDGYDLESTIHTDQVFEFHRPAVAGDQLTSTVALQSFRRAFGGDLFVVENAVTDQRGSAVFSARTSAIARSQPTASDSLTRVMAGILRSDVLAARKAAVPMTEVTDDATPTRPSGSGNRWARPMAMVSVGDRLPPRIFAVTRGDLVNYAGVCGDPNPIHWHDGTAQLLGLQRGVVAHGMLTMGLGAGYLTSWLGDPGALRQYSVRMTSPVFVGPNAPAAVEFGGVVKSLDPDTGTATVALTATFDRRRIFGRATAMVRLS
ncbi:fused (3R)-hydroxyacyl-ACP dehydratase subunits HadA/HadB [Nocardia sp. NPDC051570]|uniref:fused (3R)-hydroxyacyl-ACP dehydratase subunits HadA/HadB n=1 Tax=Nocardia sp. NPDC051570 TaxID=3364324 RepID=UPI0037B8C1DA